MSDPFYKAVRAAGTVVFRVASRPLILHAERAARPGAWLLAANHESPFDSALLIAAVPRVLTWLSITELFQSPFSRWFLTVMGALPLDRSKRDSATILRVVRALRAGAVVALFPEGGVRTGAASVLHGGAIHDGAAGLAGVANTVVIPAVVLGGTKFGRWQSWLPLRRTRWAVAFGEPLFLRRDLDRKAARAALMLELQAALCQLASEVRSHVER